MNYEPADFVIGLIVITIIASGFVNGVLWRERLII